ncbi:MAG: hypothetical protein GQ476_07270 [Candidatus Aminicenantes bacterium]|nr:hypothetical protein [Candidatus Aminicenantes bacterium]
MLLYASKFANSVTIFNIDGKRKQKISRFFKSKKENI